MAQPTRQLSLSSLQGRQMSSNPWITGWRPLNDRLGLLTTAWLQVKVRESGLSLRPIGCTSALSVTQKRRFSCGMRLVALCTCYMPLPWDGTEVLTIAIQLFWLKTLCRVHPPSKIVRQVSKVCRAKALNSILTNSSKFQHSAWVLLMSVSQNFHTGDTFFRTVIMSIHFRLRNDLYCIGWGVKLYSLTRVNSSSSPTMWNQAKWHIKAFSKCSA